MMKVKDFLDKLNLAYSQPNYYLTGGWGKWNGSKWGWDCVCIIKGILWGWNNDKSKPRGGGAIYASNGVPDIGDNAIYNACLKKSNDFSNIQVGELVHMNGHVGIYIGNGNVIEATVGWGTKKVIKSQIDSKGNRTYNGKGGSKPWTGHGFLPYIDYSELEPTNPTPQPTPEPTPQPQPTPEPTPQPQSIPEPTPQPSSFLPFRGYFKLGDRSPNVGKIAEFMYRMFPAYTKKEALGNYYGPNIKASITEFQKRTGLTSNGNVDQTTLDMLSKYGFKY